MFRNCRRSTFHWSRRWENVDRIIGWEPISDNAIPIQLRQLFVKKKIRLAEIVVMFLSIFFQVIFQRYLLNVFAGEMSDWFE